MPCRPIPPRCVRARRRNLHQLQCTGIRSKITGPPATSLFAEAHIYLRHATHLVTASPKTLRSHPYMTTPAAIAREKLLAAGKAPPTTVPSVTAGDVKGWLAHTRKVGRNDIATGTNFDGADYTGWIPPDGGLAAGPHEVITAINETVNTFTKSGTLLTSQTLDSLFTGFPQSGPFDPHVVYDPNSHRFWLVAAATDGKTNSYFYVAVSNDSDTQDGWSVWYMPANDNSAFSSDWCDYPEIGLSSGGYVYVTCNFFGLSSPGDSPVKLDSGPSALIRIIPESDFTGGGCCSWWEWWNNSFAIQPTVTVNSAATNGEYLAASSAGGGSSVTEWQINNESKCCSAAPSMYSGSASTGHLQPTTVRDSAKRSSVSGFRRRAVPWRVLAVPVSVCVEPHRLWKLLLSIPGRDQQRFGKTNRRVLHVPRQLFFDVSRSGSAARRNDVDCFRCRQQRHGRRIVGSNHTRPQCLYRMHERQPGVG